MECNSKDLVLSRYYLDTSRLSKEERSQLPNDILYDNKFDFAIIDPPPSVDLLIHEDDCSNPDLAIQLYQVYETPISEVIDNPSIAPLVTDILDRCDIKEDDLDKIVSSFIEPYISNDVFDIATRYLNNDLKYGYPDYTQYALLRYGCGPIVLDSTTNIMPDLIEGMLITLYSPPIEFFKRLLTLYPGLDVSMRSLTLADEDFKDVTDLIISDTDTE